MSKKTEFEKYIRKINKINKELLKLLSKRVKISKKIKKYKQENNLKIYNKQRENRIFQWLEAISPKYNLDKKYTKDLFKLIIKNSREIQKGKL